MDGSASLAPAHFPATGPPFVYQGVFPANIPLVLVEQPVGPQVRSNYSSESPGVTSFSSFESMSATLDPAHWGVHGGAPWDTCKGKKCIGTNVMAQRNYPCDSCVVAAMALVGLTGWATADRDKCRFRRLMVGSPPYLLMLTCR